MYRAIVAMIVAIYGCCVCTVLAIDRATFKRILGPLDDIMRRNMETYNDFFSQGI